MFDLTNLIVERAIPLVTACSTMPDVIPYEIFASIFLGIDVAKKLETDI